MGKQSSGTGAYGKVRHEDVTNSMERSLFQKLIPTQLVKKFLPFYGTRRFITVFTTAPILSQMNPVHMFSSYYSKVHSNISLLSNGYQGLFPGGKAAGV
jgi:hypothetical protein